MIFRTDDLRIAQLRPLIPPAILMEELPLSERVSTVIAEARDEATRIVRGADDRLLVVVGPCSIHDPKAALDYARGSSRRATGCETISASSCASTSRSRARQSAGKGSSTIRTSTAASTSIAGSASLARLLLDIGELGVPAGSEFLDTISPQFYR